MKNCKRLLSLAGGAALCVAIVSQGTTACGAGPQLGDVDTTNSRVYMLVGATGLGHEHGVEGQIASGHIDLGAAQNAGNLVFDMKTFAAETAAARKFVGLSGEVDASTRQQVNDNMHGADVLNVAKFPTAELVIDSATVVQPTQPGGPQKVVLDGKFTLHGVTQWVRIPAEAEVVNGMIHLRGGFAILQSQYGITPYTKFLGAVGVADEIKIWGDLWLHYR